MKGIFRYMRRLFGRGLTESEVLARLESDRTGIAKGGDAGVLWGGLHDGDGKTKLEWVPNRKTKGGTE